MKKRSFFARLVAFVLPSFAPATWVQGASYRFQVRRVNATGVVFQKPPKLERWEMLVAFLPAQLVFALLALAVAPGWGSAVWTATATAIWGGAFVRYRRLLLPMRTEAAGRAVSMVLEAQDTGRLSGSDVRKVLGWVGSADAELALVQVALGKVEAQIGAARRRSGSYIPEGPEWEELRSARNLLKDQARDVTGSLDAIDRVISHHAVEVDEGSVAEALAAARAARNSFGSVALQARTEMI